MQSLLKARFGLKIVEVSRMKPVLRLVTAKDGKTGPRLQPSREQCSVAPPVRSGFEPLPIPCGTARPLAATVAGRGRLAGRGVPISKLAELLKNPFTGLAQPVIDATRLTGMFDFDLEWSLERDPSTGALQDETGPTLLQALEDQLGLSLQSGRATVPELSVEHIDHPSED
jgi:uncharacterized protein (TIGR03435 family)